MSCQDKWCQIASAMEGAAFVAQEGVSGAPQCIRGDCEALIRQDTNLCLAGHSQQGQGDAVGQPFAEEVGFALLCLISDLEAQGLLEKDHPGERAAGQFLGAGDEGLAGQVMGEAAVEAMMGLFEELQARGHNVEDDPRVQVAQKLMSQRAELSLPVWETQTLLERLVFDAMPDLEKARNRRLAMFLHTYELYERRQAVFRPQEEGAAFSEEEIAALVKIGFISPQDVVPGMSDLTLSTRQVNAWVIRARKKASAEWESLNGQWRIFQEARERIEAREDGPTYLYKDLAALHAIPLWQQIIEMEARHRALFDREGSGFEGAGDQIESMRQAVTEIMTSLPAESVPEVIVRSKFLASSQRLGLDQDAVALLQDVEVRKVVWGTYPTERGVPDFLGDWSTIAHDAKEVEAVGPEVFALLRRTQEEAALSKEERFRALNLLIKTSQALELSKSPGRSKYPYSWAVAQVVNAHADQENRVSSIERTARRLWEWAELNPKAFPLNMLRERASEGGMVAILSRHATRSDLISWFRNRALAEEALLERFVGQSRKRMKATGRDGAVRTWKVGQFVSIALPGRERPITARIETCLFEGVTQSGEEKPRLVRAMAVVRMPNGVGLTVPFSSVERVE